MEFWNGLNGMSEFEWNDNRLSKRSPRNASRDWIPVKPNDPERGILMEYASSKRVNKGSIISFNRNHKPHGYISPPAGVSIKLYFRPNPTEIFDYRVGTMYSYIVKTVNSGPSGFEAEILQQGYEVTPSPYDSPYHSHSPPPNGPPRGYAGGHRPLVDDRQPEYSPYGPSQGDLFFSDRHGTAAAESHAELDMCVEDKIKLRGQIRAKKIGLYPSGDSYAYYFVVPVSGARQWGKEVLIYEGDVRPDHRHLTKEGSTVEFYVVRAKIKGCYNGVKCILIDCNNGLDVYCKPRYDNRDNRVMDSLDDRVGVGGRNPGPKFDRGPRSPPRGFEDDGRNSRERSFSPNPRIRHESRGGDSGGDGGGGGGRRYDQDRGRERSSQPGYSSKSPPPPPPPIEYARINMDYNTEPNNILIPDFVKDDVVEALMKSEDENHPPLWRPPNRLGFVRVKKGFVSAWVPKNILSDFLGAQGDRLGQSRSPPRGGGAKGKGNGGRKGKRGPSPTHYDRHDRRVERRGWNG